MIAESLNKYFLNIAENISLTANKLFNGDVPANHVKYMAQAFVHPFPKINFNWTTYTEVENIIRSFKPKYSKGYDEIPSVTKLLQLVFFLLD
jgi:hypothetical protein